MAKKTRSIMKYFIVLWLGVFLFPHLVYSAIDMPFYMSDTSTAHWSYTNNAVATRNIPVAYKTASGLKWFRAGLTPASIAINIGCGLGLYLAEKGADYAQGKWFEWLGLKKYEYKDNAWKSYNDARVIEAGSIKDAVDSKNTQLSVTNPSYYESSSAADSAAFAYWQWINVNVQPLNNAIKTGDTYTLNVNGSSYKYYLFTVRHQNGSYKQYFLGVVLDGSGAPVPWGTERKYTSVSTSDIANSFKADLENTNPGSASTAAKRVWESYENDLSNAINNGVSTGVLNQPVSGTSPIQNFINTINNSWSQDAETNINNYNTAQNINQEVTDSKTDETWIGKLVQSIKGLLGFEGADDSAIPNVSKTEMETEKSNTESDLSSRLQTAAGSGVPLDPNDSTVGVLSWWWSSTSDYRNAVIDKFETALSASDGVCSIGINDVFGSGVGSFTISFCDVDFTAWRTVIAIVFTIFALVLLFE